MTFSKFSTHHDRNLEFKLHRLVGKLKIYFQQIVWLPVTEFIFKLKTHIFIVKINFKKFGLILSGIESTVV